MTRIPKRGGGGRDGRGFDPLQLTMDWRGDYSPPPQPSPPTEAPISPPTTARADGLTMRLPWDFRTTFPQPTEQAFEAGLISDEDATAENIRALHEAHALEALAALSEVDALLHADLLGVDPKAGKVPKTPAGRERLRQRLGKDPDRPVRWFRTLMETYEEVFGAQAAVAFEQAIRAWYAGVVVTTQASEATPPQPSAETKAPSTEPPTPAASERSTRLTSRLPVPKPLPSAINARRFGQEEDGTPIRPGAHEVRAITERHAEKLTDLLDALHQVDTWLSSSQCTDGARLYRERDLLNTKLKSALTAYAEDFGQHAAEQLEAYARRQAAMDPARRHQR